MSYPKTLLIDTLDRHLAAGWISGWSWPGESGKKAKYNAKKIIIDEHLFASMEEGAYYLHLIEEQVNGRVDDFDLQPVFVLQPSFKKNGKSYRKIEYKADFDVKHADGRMTIVDVKGMVTPNFTLKEKMFHYVFPDTELLLVKYVKKYGGWITLDEWAKRKKAEKKGG